MAKVARAASGHVCQLVSMAVATSLLLAGAMLFFGKGHPSPPTAPLMRREPQPAVGGIPAPPQPLMRREPREAKTAAVIPNRPAEWGHLMRREPHVVVTPVIGQEPLVASSTNGRPAEWGHLMRREPHTAAAPVTSEPTPKTADTASITPLAPKVSERPAEWGQYMRREARIVVPPPVLAPVAETTGNPADIKPTPGTSQTFAAGYFLFGGIALVGFALQAKNVARGLLGMPGFEAYGLKGKAK